MSDQRTPLSLFRRVWGAPLAIGAVTTLGLIAALLGEGLWNAFSWLCLAAPVWITLHYWARSQR